MTGGQDHAAEVMTNTCKTLDDGIENHTNFPFKTPRTFSVKDTVQVKRPKVYKMTNFPPKKYIIVSVGKNCVCSSSMNLKNVVIALHLQLYQVNVDRNI